MKVLNSQLFITILIHLLLDFRENICLTFVWTFNYYLKRLLNPNMKINLLTLMLFQTHKTFSLFISYIFLNIYINNRDFFSGYSSKT